MEYSENEHRFQEKSSAPPPPEGRGIRAEDEGESMQVFLVKNATGNNYSVESGMADDVRHFDHHGEHSHYPPPSTNPKVPRLNPDDIVEITHVDADTLIALYRMAGVPVPKEVDLQLVEDFDTHGSSVVKDLTDPTFRWIRGIAKARELVGFPPAGPKEPVDVTDQIYRIFGMPFSQVAQYGDELQAKSEKNYREGLQDEDGTVGFWVVDGHGDFDPSRPYLDGYKITVVYRKQYRQIGLYAAQDTDYVLGNTVVAGIQFLGHDKACGSPRGEPRTQEEAQRVFEELAAKYAQPRVHPKRGSKQETYMSTLPNEITFKGARYIRVAQLQPLLQQFESEAGSQADFKSIKALKAKLANIHKALLNSADKSKQQTLAQLKELAADKTLSDLAELFKVDVAEKVKALTGLTDTIIGHIGMGGG